jgi:hypothetical protein
MTEAERKTVHELQDYLFKHGGDSTKVSTISPTGDGAWVSVYDVWGRHGNIASAKRRSLGRVHRRGELKAYEIALVDGMAKAVPVEQVDTVELDRYLNNPDLPEGVRQARRQHARNESA